MSDRRRAVRAGARQLPNGGIRARSRIDPVDVRGVGFVLTRVSVARVGPVAECRMFKGVQCDVDGRFTGPRAAWHWLMEPDHDRSARCQRLATGPSGESAFMFGRSAAAHTSIAATSESSLRRQASRRRSAPCMRRVMLDSTAARVCRPRAWRECRRSPVAQPARLESPRERSAAARLALRARASAGRAAIACNVPTASSSGAAASRGRPRLRSQAARSVCVTASQ